MDLLDLRNFRTPPLIVLPLFQTGPKLNFNYLSIYERHKKKYDAKFKAKVAMEAIQERETLNELAVKYEVSPVMISRWRKEFIGNSSAAFEAPKVDDTAIEKEKDRYL